MTNQEDNVLAWPGGYPESIEPGSLRTNHFSFDTPKVRGALQEVSLTGLHIAYGLFRSSISHSFLMTDTLPCVRLVYTIQGTSTYSHNASVRALVELKPQQQTLLALPEGTLQMHSLPNEITELFIITLSPAFFFDQIPPEHPLHTTAQYYFEKSQPMVLNPFYLAVMPKMLTLLFEIIQGHEGYSRSLWVKAKVIELLALQLDQVQDLGIPAGAELLKDEDKVRMQLARQLVIENLENPLSIKALAHEVGTNEYSLKKQFKAVFGKTIFGYLHDFRMEQAREQLCQNQETIAEIARRTGYQHATHFTAAFKKYFGYLPTKLR